MYTFRKKPPRTNYKKALFILIDAIAIHAINQPLLVSGFGSLDKLLWYATMKSINQTNMNKPIWGFVITPKGRIALYACVVCGTTKKKHLSKGLCAHCYEQQPKRQQYKNNWKKDWRKKKSKSK